MAKLRMLIELDFDESVMYDDEEGRCWFFNEVLGSGSLTLRENNEIGDDVGSVKVVKIYDMVEKETE